VQLSVFAFGHLLVQILSALESTRDAGAEVSLSGVSVNTPRIMKGYEGVSLTP